MELKQVNNDQNVKSISISNICWDITSRCNDNCSFCYGERNSVEISLNENKQILEKLISLNPLKISFVGGEPLLYGNKLLKLIEFGKKINDEIEYSLTSNAILLFDSKLRLNINLINKIKDYFDWFTFSLDGYNSDIQSKMTRNENHFYRIITLLEYLKKIHQKVKINTVVSKINIKNNNLIRLADLLINFKVKRWKLMHFLPSRSLAFENKEIYSIDETNFIELYNNIEYYCSEKISISKNIKNDFCNYFTISSDGKLINYDGTQYQKKIDFLAETSDSIIILIKNLNKHFRSYYDDR